MTTTIYLMLMAALGVMLAHLGAAADTWQYWVVVLISVGIYACGIAEE